MKTSFSGSRSGCALNQARRFAATSGRSCSLACAVFFEGHGMAIEETPHRAGRENHAVLIPQHRGDFDERNVNLGIDRFENDGAVKLDPARPQIAALACFAPVS
jgi:hypothetical protein